MGNNMSIGQSVFSACEKETSAIALGGVNSAAININNAGYGSFQIPSVFTGTAITVQYSIDGTNWTNVPALFHEANPITVAANGTYFIPALTFNARYMRLVSGSAEAAARTITIFLRG